MTSPCSSKKLAQATSPTSSHHSLPAGPSDTSALIAGIMKLFEAQEEKKEEERVEKD